MYLSTKDKFICFFIGLLFYHEGFVCESFPCPETCRNPEDHQLLKCDVNTTNCLHGCEIGYAGDNCSVICPTNCLLQQDAGVGVLCDAVTKECIFGCKDGFYGHQCLQRCKDEAPFCEKCQIDTITNKFICMKCGFKFYVSNGVCHSCSYRCDNSSDQICDPVNGQCLIGCRGATYGRYCDKYCSAACRKDTCEQFTGSCKYGCDPNEYCGSTCNKACSDQCVDGICDQLCACQMGCYTNFWGYKCDKTCPDNCVRMNGTETICDVSDGSCLQGCSKKEWWGEHCLTPCPINCNDNKCEPKTGHCVYGCASNKVYGEACDKECPDKCQHSTCRRSDGFCIEGCKTGWFGDRCVQQCAHCLKSVCDHMSGNCNFGCISGYEGLKCDKLSPIIPGSKSLTQEAAPLCTRTALGFMVGEGVLCIILLVIILLLARVFGDCGGVLNRQIRKPKDNREEDRDADSRNVNNYTELSHYYNSGGTCEKYEPLKETSRSCTEAPSPSKPEDINDYESYYIA